MKLKFDSEKNSYYINNPKQFANISISKKTIDTAYSFAYEMVYGSGHHRDYRTGGSHSRKKGEKFCNSLQGKIAELVLFDIFHKHGILVDEIDLGVYGEGIWDAYDINYKGKKINIKSCAYFSNLLLLESMDYDNEGKYIPNSSKIEDNSNDFFIMARIKPDLKSLFKQHRLLYSDDSLSTDFLKNLLSEVVWAYDVPGFISIEDFKILISRSYLIPKDSYLNEKTKMDADNYYIQSGNLRSLNLLIKKLSTL